MIWMQTEQQDSIAGQFIVCYWSNLNSLQRCLNAQIESIISKKYPWTLIAHIIYLGSWLKKCFEN